MRSLRRRLELAAGVSLLMLGCGCAQAAEIIVFYIGDIDSSSYLGVQQGLSEANAQGEFMGTQYRVVANSEPARGDNGAIAIIAATDPSALTELAHTHRDLAVLDVALKSSELRSQCSDNVFYVAASEAMIDDANRQWQQKMPGSSARAQAWHETFRKYAAGQLNSRFRKKFSQAMNDDAWAGWAAMKLLSDTIVRQPSITGHELINELQTNLAFDGQKGTDLSFRETGQLRQPLLLVADGKIVGEAPVRGVVNPSDLDSLGTQFCAK